MELTLLVIVKFKCIKHIYISTTINGQSLATLSLIKDFYKRKQHVNHSRDSLQKTL